MSATGALDVEAILDDLYASEISASIAWIWDSGFHTTLGDPAQAEGWAFPTIRAAVAWHSDKIDDYPRHSAAVGDFIAAVRVGEQKPSLLCRVPRDARRGRYT